MNPTHVVGWSFLVVGILTLLERWLTGTLGTDGGAIMAPVLLATGVVFLWQAERNPPYTRYTLWIKICLFGFGVATVALIVQIVMALA